jgi:hypothetical protein
MDLKKLNQLPYCFVNYKKGCTRRAAASAKVYQLLVHGWWFSPGTPASSTTKTGRHDIKVNFGLKCSHIVQHAYTRDILTKNLQV